MPEPIRIAASNVVMRGPTPDVGDAWTEITPGRTTYLTWTLTDDERKAIAEGANLRMGVWQMPIPPVSLEVDRRQPLSDDGAAWVDRARRILTRAFPSQIHPAGYWWVSRDVWTALQATGALDSGPRGGAVPTLVQRPLMLWAPDKVGALEPTNVLLFISGQRAYNEDGPTDEAATPGSLAGHGGNAGTPDGKRAVEATNPQDDGA